MQRFGLPVGKRVPEQVTAFDEAVDGVREFERQKIPRVHGLNLREQRREVTLLELSVKIGGDTGVGVEDKRVESDLYKGVRQEENASGRFRELPVGKTCFDKIARRREFRQRVEAAVGRKVKGHAARERQVGSGHLSGTDAAFTGRGDQIRKDIADEELRRFRRPCFARDPVVREEIHGFGAGLKR